jgi:hypothetical protein
MTQPNTMRLSHESREKSPSIQRQNGADAAWSPRTTTMTRANDLLPKSDWLNNSQQRVGKVSSPFVRHGGTRMALEIFRCNGRAECYAPVQFTQQNHDNQT